MHPGGLIPLPVRYDTSAKHTDIGVFSYGVTHRQKVTLIYTMIVINETHIPHVYNIDGVVQSMGLSGVIFFGVS
jgi:hypothetical protein